MIWRFEDSAWLGADEFISFIAFLPGIRKRDARRRSHHTEVIELSLAQALTAAISEASISASSAGDTQITNQGQVYVFEDLSIFTDGFKSGDVCAWNDVSPLSS